MSFFETHSAAILTILVILQYGRETFTAAVACKSGCGDKSGHHLPDPYQPVAPYPPLANPLPPVPAPLPPIAAQPYPPINLPIPVPRPFPPVAPAHPNGGLSPGILPFGLLSKLLNPGNLGGSVKQDGSEDVDVSGIGNIISKLFDFVANINIPIEIL